MRMSDAIWLLDARGVTKRSIVNAEEQLGDASRRVVASFTSEIVRRRFLLSRALLRSAVATWTHGDARNVDIEERTSNAPAIRGGAADVFVSLSHTGDWIACAVGDSPVGVDIERTERARDLVGMSATFFSLAEHTWLLQQPDHAAAFYALWTGKEAMFKVRQQVDGDGHVLDTHFNIQNGQLHATVPTRQLCYSSISPFLVGSVARAVDGGSHGASLEWKDARTLVT